LDLRRLDLAVREHESDGVAAAFALKREKIEINRVIRRVGAQSVDQGPGKRPFINKNIDRDSERDIKNKSWNLCTTEGGTVLKIRERQDSRAR
jgi:hypothetical protein